MTPERFIYSGGRRLRCGYTTGTCAALASSGAARLLLSGVLPETLSVRTPAGVTVEAEPEEWELSDDAARCAVRKDAGDDPDVTDGCLVRAEVRKLDFTPQGEQGQVSQGQVSDCGSTQGTGGVSGGIVIDGGDGVGRVTKPGLDQPVGAAAINSVPRRMIAEAVDAVRAAVGYTGALSVIISVPDGERIAARTFNSALGVEGGVSILGTTGIVEPMSEQAVVGTLAVQIRQAAADGENRLILTPGNYGADFLRRSGLSELGVPVVRCSNFIGDALDLSAAAGFRSVLLVGHIGKLVKLAGNIFNTHSRWADCRAELFCAHAAVSGADAALCRALLESATTDACVELLDRAGLRRAVMSSLLRAVQRNLDRRTERAEGAQTAPAHTGVVVFSNVYGFLGATAAAESLLSRWDAAGNFVKVY